MLPKFAPEKFRDRETLWNDVEMFEKAKNSQLAREVEISIPVEIPESQRVQLIREYCQKNFVDKGMLADFCIHTKDPQNPHVHILLSIRPFNEDGTWGAKCRKEYLYDSYGNPKLDKNGKKQSRRVDTTDWNNRQNSEIWRESWANICNSYLEKNGQAERIDHRSYKRQGKEEIPNIHNSVAVSEMEKRGIQTDRGEIHREISAYNKDLSSMRARITRLKAWQREIQAKPLDLKSANIKLSVTHLMESQVYNNEKYRTLTNLKNTTKAMTFLSDNNITDLNSFMDKISEMNDSYYVLRGEVQKVEKQEAVLTKKIALGEEYKDLNKILKHYKTLSPKEQKAYLKNHGDKLARAEEVKAFFKANLKEGEKINTKEWRKQLSQLDNHKNIAKWKCDAYKDELRRAELLRELVDEQMNGQAQEQQRGQNKWKDR